MKKILIALTIAISCLGISRVSADTIILSYNDTLLHNCDFYYTDFDYIKELGYENKIQEIYRLLLEEYNANYASEYPYFYVDIVVIDEKNCNSTSSATNKIEMIRGFLNFYSDLPTYSGTLKYSSSIIYVDYHVSSTTYDLPQVTTDYSYPIILSNSFYNPMAYFISNFDLINNSEDTYVVNGNSNFTINPGDIIKPYYSVDNAFQNTYTEINLNNYAYVALALKDYNKKAFETTIQVKGQYCLTPVYNYGMTERKDILTGTQVDRCSPYYDNYTPIRTYILENDLKNNAIYYLKSYDSSRDNYVKVDTSVFDVTYVTEENKDNPYVTIGGKTYPTIPYDNLTDTATKSEDEGYVSGAVEEFSFSDIFTAPLEFLKDIWDSIVSVFDLVKEFFSLLPEPIPTFLLSSFLLGLAIGLLKLIF